MKTPYLMLAALSFTVFAVACAGRTEAEAPDAGPAVEVTAAAQLVDQSASTPATSAGLPVPGDLKLALTFNSCSCTDLSQVRDCRSGTCYCYYSSYRTAPMCCYSGGSCIYTYTCPVWQSYRC